MISPIQQVVTRGSRFRTPALLCLLLVGASEITHAQKHWTRSLGGGHNEEAWSVTECSDRDGFVLTGWTTSWGPGGQDYSNTFVMRVDEFGDVAWKTALGDTYNEYPSAIIETRPDHGYMVCATRTVVGSNDDIVMYRLGNSGGLLWERKIGGPGMENARCVRQTRGGFIVAGARSEGMFGSADMYALWLNARGDTLRTRRFGGDAPDWATAVEVLADGGVFLGGNTYSFGAGGIDWYMVRTDANGNVLWERAYGTSRSELLYALCPDGTGGFIAVGTGYPPGSDRTDVMMLRLRGDGAVYWWKYFGSAASEEGYAVRETTDGDFVACGLTNSVGPYQSLYLIRVDASGNLRWARTYGGSGSDMGYSVDATRDGGVIAAGMTTSWGPGYQVYLVRTDGQGLLSEPSGFAGLGSLSRAIRVHPNPFRDSASIRGHEAEIFRLFDATGRVVARNRGDRLGAGLPPGVYFLSPSEATGDPVRIVKLP